MIICAWLKVNRCTEGLNYFWVSEHEAVDVVVDLFEHKASVHERKTALEKTWTLMIITIIINSHYIKTFVWNIYTTYSGMIQYSMFTKHAHDWLKGSAHLDENSNAVIGVSGGIQVIFIFLSDVRHEHGH